MSDFYENDIVFKMFNLLKMHCPIEFSMTVGGCRGDLPVICHSKHQTHEEEGLKYKGNKLRLKGLCISWSAA